MFQFSQDMSFLAPNVAAIISDPAMPDFIRWAAAKNQSQEYITSYELFTTMSDKHLDDLTEYEVASSRGDHGNNTDQSTPEYAAFQYCMFFTLILGKGEGTFFREDGTDAEAISEAFNRMLIMTRVERLRRMGKVEINPHEFTITPSGDDKTWFVRTIENE